LELLESC